MSDCEHNMLTGEVELETGERTVSCVDCGAKLDPAAFPWLVPPDAEQIAPDTYLFKAGSPSGSDPNG